MEQKEATITKILIKLKIQTIKYNCVFGNYLNYENSDFKQPNQVIISFICST